MTTRPRLTPAIADIRRAVRTSLAELTPGNAGAGVSPHAGDPASSPGAFLPNAGDPASRSAAFLRNAGDPASRSAAFLRNAGDPASRSAAFLRNAGDPALFDTGAPGLRGSDAATPAFGREAAATPGRELRGAASGGANPEQANGATLVLVALSGGPDSLALAAATVFEAPRAGILAGAVVVDHGLQQGSADVAARAAGQAAALGLHPVLVKRVIVGGAGGPEAAARSARYSALATAAEETGAAGILLGHTLDDQAETVLLGLARGSGASSLWGMETRAGLYVRPLLGIRRATTVQACADAGLEPWLDPQNRDDRFTRVRVRDAVLPVLEQELGPGIAEALARTAEQLREDADALDHFAEEQIEELAGHAEAGISLPVKALAANPPALRQRIIRLAVAAEFGVSLGRVHTLEVARLVTDWHGQKPLDLPGVRVERRGGLIVFSAQPTATASTDQES